MGRSQAETGRGVADRRNAGNGRNVAGMQGEGGCSLLCYTRRPTGRETANNDDIALSMHLALRSPVSGAWEPLNENYGVYFAAAVPVVGVPDSARGAATAGALFPCEPSADGASGKGVSGAVRCRAVMPERDVVLKSLKDPYIFRLRPGAALPVPTCGDGESVRGGTERACSAAFGIVATRIDRGGDADGSERSSLLLAVSSDLRSFTQLGLVKLPTGGGVHRPRMRFDQVCDRYVARWLDDSGMPHCAVTRNICGQPPLTSADAGWREVAALAGAAERTVAVPSDGAVSYGIADCVPGNVIALSKAEVSALVGRFGRIHNIGVDATAVRFAAHDGMSLGRQLESWKVTLRYSDGSTARRSVDWDSASVRALQQAASAGTWRSGENRTVHGTVRQARYPVPFAKERADPSVFAWNWNGEPMFMFIATDDTDGNCVDPNNGATHMPLRVGSSIAELSDEAGGRAREIDLLRRGDVNSEGRSMTGCFWAPELHVIAGRLSVLFMPCFDGDRLSPDGSANDRAGKPDMWTGSCHIMQLKQDGGHTYDGRPVDLDPRNPGNWSVPKPILAPSGGALNPVQSISLDMTVFEDSGRWYYAWQQVGSVWIASFDPADPAVLTSEPRQIVVPEFAWDNAIAEGPNVLEHDGTLFLIYSGSLVGIDYTTGLACAPAGRGVDLLNPAVWRKLDYPLQKSGLYNGSWQLGTGHGMWSHDEDGNLLYVFHNAEYRNGRYGGRDAQVRRVHWAADGMPVLDMQTDEELDPAYRRVAVEVTLC